MDNSRYLHIDAPNTINRPTTRMDLTFWKNIVELNEDPVMIQNNTQFYQFNQVFDGYSLFHYFAKSLEVIEMLHDKYTSIRDDEGLSK